MDEESIDLMCKLQQHFREVGTNIEDFLLELTVQKNVKIEGRQRGIHLVRSADFFSLLEKTNLKEDGDPLVNLEETLQLSLNFHDLLMIPKLVKMMDAIGNGEAVLNASASLGLNYEIMSRKLFDFFIEVKRMIEYSKLTSSITDVLEEYTEIKVIPGFGDYPPL